MPVAALAPVTTVTTGRLFKVLADPTRLALLRRLAAGDASVGELMAAVGVSSQSRVSNHLACLRWCQLVTSVKVGRQVLYRLADRQVIELINRAAAVAAAHADPLATCSRLGPDWVR